MPAEMPPSPAAQLAKVAAVTDDLDKILDGLFASVADLKAIMVSAAHEPKAVPLTESMPQESVQQTASRLARSLDGMSTELKAVRKRQDKAEETARKLRRITIGLAISLVLDLFITAGLGWNTVRESQNQNSSHADEVTACQQANVDRSEDAAVWGTFLGDIAPPKARTPKVTRLLTGIDKRIAAKDRIRDCAALYRT